MSPPAASAQTGGEQVRAVIFLLLQWAFFGGLLGTLGVILGILAVHNIGKEEWFGAALFGLLSSGLLYGLIRVCVSWGRSVMEAVAQARSGPVLPTEGADIELTATRAIATPWGSVGQLVFVVYLFTLHPLWLERLRAAPTATEPAWLTLGVVALAIGLDHWGSQGLMDSLPQTKTAQGARSALSLMGFMFRVAFLSVFAGAGLAAARVLEMEPDGTNFTNSGANAAVVMGLLLLMMAKEAWLAGRVSRRSPEATIPLVWHEAAQWLGAVLMFGLVELLVLSEAPIHSQEGAVVVLATTLLLFTFFWIPLQLPQFIRHFAARTSIRQELSWWGSTLMVYAAVGARLWG